MHTVEHETHAPVPAWRKFRFLRSEDTTLAVLASWTLGLVLFTLAGFYFGTIAGHENHPPEGIRHVDLNPSQLEAALPYALSGLVLGLLFALWITFAYVPTKLRELEQEQGGH